MAVSTNGSLPGQVTSELSDETAVIHKKIAPKLTRW